MSSLFFWIIVLSFVVPMVMRMYRRSQARRDREQGFHSRQPEEFPGQYGPGGFPGSGQYPGQFPGSAGPQNSQPRDGYTQQDYFSGGYYQPRPIDSPQPLPSQYGEPPMPDPRYGAPQEPPFQQPAAPHSGPATPPAPAVPQGFRARKLAELDQQYSNGELSMEDYMKRRGEIMNG